MDARKLPITVRVSTVALVAAAFLGGLAAGLLAAHAWVEADADLASLRDSAALRARSGDRVAVHGLLVDRTVVSTTGPGETRFTYLLALDDGTARVEFPVPQADFSRLEEGTWVVVDLRWTGAGYEPGPPEKALQPWMWRAAGVVAVLVALAGAASRVAEHGLAFRRKGDLIEIRPARADEPAPPKPRGGARGWLRR